MWCAVSAGRHTGGSHQKSRHSRSEEKKDPRKRDLKDQVVPYPIQSVTLKDRFVYHFISDFCLCVMLPACITICIFGAAGGGWGGRIVITELIPQS